MIHELKTWPGAFRAIWTGRKMFEIRRQDRPFAVGDTLVLREWMPRARRYTGRRVHVLVGYMVSAGQRGLPADLCVMGFSTGTGFRR